MLDSGPLSGAGFTGRCFVCTAGVTGINDWPLRCTGPPQTRQRRKASLSPIPACSGARQITWTTREIPASIEIEFAMICSRSDAVKLKNAKMVLFSCQRTRNVDPTGLLARARPASVLTFPASRAFSKTLPAIRHAASV